MNVIVRFQYSTYLYPKYRMHTLLLEIAVKQINVVESTEIRKGKNALP